MWRALRIAVGITMLVLLLTGSASSILPTQDGLIWTWGINDNGQLGDGTTTMRLTPVKVSGLTGITSIAGGGRHTIALKSDGTVWTWGINGHGQLGDGTQTNRLTPVQVSGLTGITSIAGGGHTIALKSDGTVWTWGHNGYGQLGDGTQTDRLIPVQVSGLTGITSIAGGGSHTIALKSDGTVWIWGHNGYGQLGDGTKTMKLTPIRVSGLTGITSIAGSGSHTIALKSDGTVWTWGYNWYGQLGDGTQTNRLTPVQVSGLSNVIAIAGGHLFTIALKSDGTVWAWGRNYYGQLGDGTQTNRLTPVQVSGLSNVIAIAAGEHNTVALKSDGTVWTWGYNWYGQLGDGTQTNRLTPVQVSELSNVIAIAGGSLHTVALQDQDKTLLQIEGQPEVYWHQNSKLYWVTDWDVINQMSGIPGWDSVNTLSDSEFYPADYDQGPRFINTAAISDGLLIREQGQLDVYLISGGEKHHIISEEVFLSNGYSFDDVIDVSAQIIQMFPTGNDIGTGPISVGQGAPTLAIEQLFIDAYDRNGGVSVLDDPATVVHNVWGYWVQDFPGVPSIPGGVIMYNSIQNNAYYIHGAIWEKYYNYPNKAELGPIKEDEKDAAPSQQGTTGRYSKFETGTIHWISDDNVDHPQKGQSFVTYGDLDALYTSMGGTYNNLLGFPVMDQEERDGHGYCEFEGGLIEWDAASGGYIAKEFETLTVTSPNGEENWQIGTTQTIRWIYTGNLGSDVTIEILKSGAVVQTFLYIPIGNDGSGSFDWTIPSTLTLGSDYQVRITSTTNSAFMDNSGNFDINVGYAIIVAGQDQGSLWPPKASQKFAMDHSANNAYRVLRNLGFDNDHIFYLNDVSQQIDGQNVVDKSASLDNLQNSLDEIKEKIGDSPTPLILYYVGHGLGNVLDFYTGDNTLSSADLRNMLEPFHDKPMLIVIGSCYSGSFITTIVPPHGTDTISGDNRIIITASHDDEETPWSILGLGSWYHSSDRFWGNLNDGLNVRDAFVTDAWPIDLHHLWIDDNGDKIGHPPDALGNDGTLAGATKIGVVGVDNLELIPWYEVWIHSPGEVRVYDSQNRVTGLLNGEIKEEIPSSIYDEENKIVAIFSPSDTYRYEVVGIDTGTYGLDLVAFNGNEVTMFNALDIPTTSEQNHQYIMDWEALSNGEKGVTLQIDFEGDGIFDRTIQAGSVLTPPVANAGADQTVNEGDLVSFSGSFTDPGVDDIHTIEWDFGDGNTRNGVLDPAHIFADNGINTVMLTVTDDDGALSSDTLTVTVNNVAPTINSITPLMDPFQIGTAITASAAFNDPGAGDTHNAVWNWGDEFTSSGTITGGSGEVTGNHAYVAPGIYTISLTVTDDDGGVVTIDSSYYIVVYDPEGGFVTGGGWINSPEGAYTSDPILTGKANFGFVSKYKKGANVPTGKTEFQFKVANLNFHSTSYDWLVVAGARAKFKGKGTINGEGNLGFMLTAIDGGIPGADGVDKFRIKIWDKDNGDMVIYDNQPGEADDSDLTTEIKGGSITIHNVK